MKGHNICIYGEMRKICLNYPCQPFLSRVLGSLCFPISFLGLMLTSAILFHIMQFINITIDIRNVCVFLAPLFSSLTTLVTYQLTKELKVGKELMLMGKKFFDQSSTKNLQ